jgi:hypothetical protein
MAGMSEAQFLEGRSVGLSAPSRWARASLTGPWTTPTGTRRILWSRRDPVKRRVPRDMKSQGSPCPDSGAVHLPLL